ncbi:hypothetical protein K0M31_013017, partial [Melipona bicolor]
MPAAWSVESSWHRGGRDAVRGLVKGGGDGGGATGRTGRLNCNSEPRSPFRSDRSTRSGSLLAYNGLADPSEEGPVRSVTGWHWHLVERDARPFFDIVGTMDRTDAVSWR